MGCPLAQTRPRATSCRVGHICHVWISWSGDQLTLLMVSSSSRASSRIPMAVPSQAPHSQPQSCAGIRGRQRLKQADIMVGRSSFTLLLSVMHHRVLWGSLLGDAGAAGEGPSGRLVRCLQLREWINRRRSSNGSLLHGGRLFEGIDCHHRCSHQTRRPPPSPHKEGDVSGAISSWVHNGGRGGRGLGRETTLQLRQAPGKGDPLSWNRGMGTAATVSGPTWV